MFRPLLLMMMLLLLPLVCASAQERRFALASAEGLVLHNVKAEAVTHEGKRGVRVSYSDEARRKQQQQASAPIGQQSALLDKLAVIAGTADFSSGMIEAEIAGGPEPGAAEGARGFVGIAFRVQPDLKTYDAFYLRPTNGRADDQVRRNHSTQYISHPDWTFARFRKEAPERYESYVDLVPGAWTSIRIEVRGEKAKLYVHGQPQPVLLVNDLKSGASARGSVALWIDVGTEAHFRNVRITALDASSGLR